MSFFVVLIDIRCVSEKECPLPYTIDTIALPLCYIEGACVVVILDGARSLMYYPPMKKNGSSSLGIISPVLVVPVSSPGENFSAESALGASPGWSPP